MYVKLCIFQIHICCFSLGRAIRMGAVSLPSQRSSEVLTGMTGLVIVFPASLVSPGRI